MKPQLITETSALNKLTQVTNQFVSLDKLILPPRPKTPWLIALTVGHANAAFCALCELFGSDKVGNLYA